MLYRFISKTEEHLANKEHFAILEVANTVLQERGVCITDGNAASDSTQIYCYSGTQAQVFQQQLIEMRAVLSGPRISWYNNPELERELMAECLVPSQVDPIHIRKFFVANSDVVNSLQARLKPDNIWRLEVKEILFSPF